MTEHDPPPWTTLGSSEVYRNPWMRVRQDDVLRPDGSTGIYGVVTLAGGAGVLPFVDADHVLLVRQRRYITGAVTWEMPTGGIDPGETPEQAAVRELAEETGHRAGRLRHLNSHTTSKSVVDEWAHLFVAEDLTPLPAEAVAGLAHDDSEVIRHVVVPWEQLLGWVLDGTVVDAMTIVAVLLVDRQRRAAGPAG